MEWKSLQTPAQVDELIKASHQKDILIFKHSTSCSISSIAKHRLESNWNFQDNLVPYYLDLLAFRNTSNYIVETLSVPHESPQILLLRDGEAFFDSSHLDITVAEIHEVLEFANK